MNSGDTQFRRFDIIRHGSGGDHIILWLDEIVRAGPVKNDLSVDSKGIYKYDTVYRVHCTMSIISLYDMGYYGKGRKNPRRIRFIDFTYLIRYTRHYINPSIKIANKFIKNSNCCRVDCHSPFPLYFYMK